MLPPLDPRPAPEPVDLISLAGGSVLKRLVPLLVVVVVVAMVVFLIAR